MKRLVFPACVLAAGVIGYLLGSMIGTDSMRNTPRVERETAPGGRRLIRLPAEAVVAWRRKVERAERDRAEVRRLQAHLAELEPESARTAAEELPVGSRRKDGSIVGGARWSRMTTTMALGFLDSMVSEFFSEAKLTKDQEQRLRAELEHRIGEAMQITADFINGDIDGDQAYAFLDALAADGRKTVDAVLDADQLTLYRKFEAGVAGFVNSNVVNNEMAGLRKPLHLDRDQEERVRAVVARRYSLVQKRLAAPIPNMFFKPLRRELDRDIYDETGRAIKELLDPGQAAAFDTLEAAAPEALFAYRSLLVPKTP